jgi:GT2 family glycosyltransferase
MNKSISVVIPNYNGVHLLGKNLPLLLEALQLSTDRFEIIISDDCSTDDSIAFLQKEYPFVKCLQSSKNEGFSSTINKGIAKATYELVFLLNSDVALFPDFFIPMFKYFEQESTFGVMGKIIGLEDAQIQDGAKYPMLKGSKLYTTINYSPAKASAISQWWPSLFLSGANALVHREKLQLLGGFDDLFSPFYMEDADLGLRAWRMGWKCYYEPDSICRHPASTTIGHYHKKREIEKVSVRNRAFFHHIHHSQKELWSWKVKMRFTQMIQSLMPSSAKKDGINAYFELQNLAQQSRVAFLALQKAQKKPEKYLQDVVKELNSEINSSLIERF